MLGLENIVEFSNKNTIMKFLNSYLSLGLNSHGQNIFHSLIFAHLKKKLLYGWAEFPIPYLQFLLIC